MKNTILTLKFALLLLILSLHSTPATAFATCEVGGVVFENTTWRPSDCSEYIVTNNLIVLEDILLTLEAGTVIKFGGNRTLRVQGTLAALGTEALPIIITSSAENPLPGDWGHIYFTETGSDNFGCEDNRNILRHTIIEYAEGNDGDQDAAIRIEGVSPCIENSTIRNNDATAIWGWSGATPRIESNFLVGMNGYDGARGILLQGSRQGAELFIHDNVVTNFRNDGIYIHGSRATSSIKDNVVSHNQESGLDISLSAFTIIEGNQISNNGSGGIYMHASGAIVNNVITENTTSGNGGGIYIANGGVSISNNVIANNTAAASGGGIKGGNPINDNMITYNIAQGGDGGGIDSTGAIYDNEIKNNMASRSGGGIFTTSANVQGNVIIANSAGSYGGGLYSKGTNSTQTGDLSDNVIVNNVANSKGGGVFVPNGDAFAHRLNGNDICGNRDSIGDIDLYNGRIDSTEDLDIKNNYWGVIEYSDIESRIWHNIDDANLGFANYFPSATESVTDGSNHCLTVDETTLGQIDNVDADGSYALSWSLAENAADYELQEQRNGGSWVTIYEDTATTFAPPERGQGQWCYRVRGTNATGSGVWSNSECTTVSSNNTGSGSNCLDAQFISTSGSVQRHAFSQQGEADWLEFGVVAGQSYVIEGRPILTSTADLVLEVYNSCDNVPIDNQAYSFAPGVHMQFDAPQSGIIYMRWTNNDPSLFGVETAYDVSVRALSSETQPGAVIIVAGRLNGTDSLQSNIHNITNDVYRLFTNHNYPDERIQYLATDLSLDPTGDGQADVDGLPTVANLQNAITTWALDYVSADQPLTLYLVDHGGYDRFYLDNLSNELLSPDDLNTWLDQLEAAVPDLIVNVIIEACNSGSFIDQASRSQSISKDGRLVITTAGAYNLAYASDDGAIFSDHFIAALDRDQSVFSSFDTGLSAVKSAKFAQTPWLDADGDSVPNEADDYDIAAQRGFAFAGTFNTTHLWPPYIVSAEPITIDNTNGEIRVEVRDDLGVDAVHAVVYPPSYTPPADGEAFLNESLPTLVLLDQGNNQFGATYTGFDEQGTYRIVIHAEDDDDLAAQPLTIEVTNGVPTAVTLRGQQTTLATATMPLLVLASVSVLLLIVRWLQKSDQIDGLRS